VANKKALSKATKVLVRWNPALQFKATTSLGEVNIFLAMFIALKCVNTWQRWTEMCGNIPNKLHCLAAINDHNGHYCKHQGQAQKA
jgi:uncharacterized protein YdgA (DUF945 family)